MVLEELGIIPPNALAVACVKVLADLKHEMEKRGAKDFNAYIGTVVGGGPSIGLFFDNGAFSEDDHKVRPFLIKALRANRINNLGFSVDTKSKGYLRGTASFFIKTPADFDFSAARKYATSIGLKVDIRN